VETDLKRRGRLCSSFICNLQCISDCTAVKERVHTPHVPPQVIVDIKVARFYGPQCHHVWPGGGEHVLHSRYVRDCHYMRTVTDVYTRAHRYNVSAAAAAAAAAKNKIICSYCVPYTVIRLNRRAI